MYLHAERFNTQEEAEQRYLAISDAMRLTPTLDCAIFNIGVGESVDKCEDHVVAIVAEIEVPHKVLESSVAGAPYRLDFRMWQALILHHFHSRNALSEPGWSRFEFGGEALELLPDGTIEGFDKRVEDLYRSMKRET